jgi:hypothetical protein
MKQINAFLLTLFIIVLATSCKKDDGNDWNPPRTGDYFTCLVNGERFETEGSFNCSSKTFYYYPEGSVGLDDSYLVAGGTNCETSEAVNLRFEGITPITGYFDLTDTLVADSCFPIYTRVLSLNGFYDQLQSGYIDIAEFSPRNDGQGEFGNFEGRFAFTVGHDSLETIYEITEGQFRFAVPNIW